MKQAILYGAGDLRLEDRPAAPLEDRQVRVRTLITALSTGTDLGNYEGRSTELPLGPPYPRAVGYSNAGVIVEAGPAVRKWRVGERVFSLRPHQSGFVAAEDDLLVPLPEGLCPEEASLAYLAQLGVAALRQAGYQAGENVAVVGLGIIGLCAVAVARAMGAKVAAVANSPQRAEAAVRVGAHATYIADHTPAVFGDAGADIVILTANTWPAYRLSLEIAAYGGRVSLLGFPGRAQPLPDFNPLDPRWIYGKQLSLLGAGFCPKTECPPADIRFNLRRNLEFVLDRMASGALGLDALITHRLPAARMREAYQLAAAHSKELIAAVFDWSGME
ncbi:MAG TPA: zinc-binding dehydrogenase [Bryobacteraceae bacterium]|nr:zinc-binding dehydrogenase [Bryobacteraceae bacterium]